MFASVQKLTAPSNLIDRLLKNRNEIDKAISEIPGFLSIYLIKAPEGLTSVSLCKTKESAEESARTMLGLMKLLVPELLITPPLSTTGEVAFQLTALEAHI